MNPVLIPPLAVPLVLCHSRALSDASFNSMLIESEWVGGRHNRQLITALIRHCKSLLGVQGINQLIIIVSAQNDVARVKGARH